MTNHYDVLGVPESADDVQIKKAYRSLSLKYHPDRNSTEEAKNMMNQINNAYEILGDNESRQRYDHERKFGGGHPMQMPNQEEFQDINNIFNMMFGGAGNPFGGVHMNANGGPNIRVFHNGNPGNFHFTSNLNQIIKPQPINKHIVITLEQCYNGCVVEVEIERTIQNDSEVKKETESMYINVPSGINDKEVVTLHGKGNIVNSHVGDIKFSVHIENKTKFIRQGLDIILKEKISLKQSLCGFIFEFTYLNGKKFSLNNMDNYTIIKPDFKKIIPNMGITRENTKGNLIIHFEVDFPNTLEKEVRDKLNEILT